MVLKLTSKAITHFKLGELKKLDSSGGILGEWYLNIFNCGRYRYFIATETETLFAVVFSTTGLKSDSNFLKHLFYLIREHLTDLGCEALYEKYIMPKTGLIHYGKTDNKAMLGTMNDQVHMAQAIMIQNMVSEYEATQFVNNTPYKRNVYLFPSEKMKSLMKELA